MNFKDEIMNYELNNMEEALGKVFKCIEAFANKIGFKHIVYLNDKQWNID